MTPTNTKVALPRSSSARVCLLRWSLLGLKNLMPSSPSSKRICGGAWLSRGTRNSVVLRSRSRRGGGVSWQGGWLRASAEMLLRRGYRQEFDIFFKDRSSFKFAKQLSLYRAVSFGGYNVDLAHGSMAGVRGAQTRRAHRQARTLHAAVLLQSLFRGVYASRSFRLVHRTDEHYAGCTAVHIDLTLDV